jgi:hypothetical protein
MHLISWKLLRSALRLDGDVADPEATVSMTNAVFRLLMEAALNAQPFDSRAYLAANPDVGRSIRRGECPGAREHYITLGYYEARDLGGIGFDEAWYLARNQDVARAVQKGETTSGLEHYRGLGADEWRSPSKEADPAIARWRAAINLANGARPAGSAATERVSPPQSAARRNGLNRSAEKSRA